MRIMLVCAGGMSTSILMNKMTKWADENAIDLTVKAFAANDYVEHLDDFDIVMTGPQIRHREEEIRNSTSLPVTAIDPMYYALANAEAIIKQAMELVDKEIL